MRAFSPATPPARRPTSVGSFSPASISGLRSRLLDANTFTSPIDSKYYLKDSSTTNTHLPRQGRCWLFDGSDDIAVFGDSTSPSTTNITACAFIKMTADTTGSIVGKSINGDWSLNVESGRVRLRHGLSGNYDCTSPLTYSSANGWIHVVSCYDSATATAKLFVNGLLVNTVTSFAPIVNTAARIAVGAARQAPGSDAYQLNANIRDVRIYTVTKSDAEILSIYNQSLTGVGTFDSTGLWAAYPCNEESGTTGYDISGNGNHLTLTNITQATFHAADTGVTANPNNAEGYRLSSSVYIPKRLTDSLAADGNALTVTGRAAYHGCAETPCFTGNGSNTSITISSVLASITGDFEFTGWFKTGQTYGALWGNSTNGLYLNTLTSLRFYVGGVLTQFACTVVSGQWHYIRVTRISGTVAMWLDNVSLTQNAGTNPNTGTITTTSLANGFSTFAFTGGLADFRFTVGGVTTYFPLQDGPGSSNTNRDIAWVKSDGTGGVVSSAIVNGTVSTIWGNRVPGNVEDWCVKYGGRIAANGAFVAGMLAGGNAADGSAKTLTAGKFGNPFSRLNLNPASAAELNGRSVPTAAAAGADINATITPTDSGFRRTASDGDDRILLYDDTLSGADLSNVEGYVA